MKKPVTGNKRAKVRNRWQARENLYPVRSTREYVTSGKHGKHVTERKRGKLATGKKGGKHVTSAERGKHFTCVNQGKLQPAASAEITALLGKVN